MSADDENKWTRPSNPPPPLFLGERERNLVKQVNDELLERVIGQQITYLPISMERTNFHPLYGEAIEKSFLPPVRVYALVEFDGIETTTENYGLDKSNSIIVRFHQRRLFEDQDLYVREGDYIQYGSSFFEITLLKQGRQLFGQIDHLFQIEATCIRTRKGLLDLEVLPADTVSAILDSTPEDTLNVFGQSIVRIVYTQDSVAIIAAGTSLNDFLGVSGKVAQARCAVYEDGLRQKLTNSPSTGEFYIQSGELFNTFELGAGRRIILEALTLV